MVLPRSTLTKAALSNAMRVDIAMGGSTNTILHLLAAAQEAEVDFDQATSVRGRGHAVHAPSLRA